MGRIKPTPILLICQVLGAVLLPVNISLAVEALSFRLGSSFGFIHESGNFLADCDAPDSIVQ